jgi:hypothetical protein
MESGFKPRWRMVLGWTDHEVFKSIDIEDTKRWKEGKICSEQVLNFLNRWYKDTLLDEQLAAYSGLTLTENFIDIHVESQVPVIKVTEPPVIVSVSSVVQSGWQLYNDIEVRGQMALVAAALEVDTVCYQRLTIGPRGSIDDTVIFIGEDGHTRTRKMISDILQAIKQGADYPIVSERCSDCSFRRRCII